MVRRLRTRGEANGLGARAVRPCSASSAASWSSPSIATVAPWSAATARSVSAKATSGWNAPIWVPAAIAGARTSAPRAPLVWIIAWPLYIRTLARHRLDRVVGDGQDDELDLLDEGLRLGEPARSRRPRPMNRSRQRRIAAGDGMDRPAGTAQGDAEGGPDGARADDARVRRLARARRGGGDGRGRPGGSSSPCRWWPGGTGSRSIPAASMAASVSARSRSGSSPGSRPQAFTGGPVRSGIRPAMGRPGYACTRRV